MTIKYKKRTVPYARKREGKTDYRKRLRLIKGGKTRLTIRKMLNNISVQFIGFYPEGDRTLVGVHSRELIKMGWKGHRGNIQSAYLAGYLAGMRALKKGIKEAVVDFGMFRSVRGGRMYAVIKGVVDAGVSVNCKKEMFPSEDVLSGRIIEDYVKKLGERGRVKYAECIRRGLDVANFSRHVDEVKKEIERKC